jgi:hypothetical protein
MSSAKDPGGDDSTENDKDGNDSGSGGRPEIGGFSPLSVTGVGTLRSGQCMRNDYERLRDTFGAFMKASVSSGYGNLPWLPR